MDFMHKSFVSTILHLWGMLVTITIHDLQHCVVGTVQLMVNASLFTMINSLGIYLHNSTILALTPHCRKPKVIALAHQSCYNLAIPMGLSMCVCVGRGGGGGGGREQWIQMTDAFMSTLITSYIGQRRSSHYMHNEK